MPQGADNLAFRAARAYETAAGVDLRGFSIRIEKRIPSQAGMAGGSSDAAAVLRALNRRFGAFSDAELRALGLTLGSDVPYCLFGGVALAEGRGERLTRLPDLPKGLTSVLIRPDFAVSTPALFRELDKVSSCHPERSEGSLDSSSHPLLRMTETGADTMLQALNSGDAAQIGAALGNDFAPVLAREHPIVETVKTALLSRGALGAELTGTGSVIYGLFGSEAAAQEACAALSPQFPFTVVTGLCHNPAGGQ